MKVVVVGTGYVGLVAGAGFADFGNDVICVDRDVERIERLRRRDIPFYEPGLYDLVARNETNGRLVFSTDTTAAVAGADIVFIAVGTPQGAQDGSADVSSVLEATRAIGRGLTGACVVVTKSTVPVGTTDKVREVLAAEASKHEVAVANNPEFLKEGDAVNDFMKPARVVVGAEDERAIDALRSLYAPFVRTNDRMYFMDIRSAELTKYASNALLASRVSFMNELALLAERVGADVELVRKGVGADPRIGPKFLFAGPGFGGSCFPKDLRALLRAGREHDLELFVVEGVERANERQKKLLGGRIKDHFGGDLRHKRIAVWGLSFKPETDDIREAPALTLIGDLRAAGATVVAYDPQGLQNTRRLLRDTIEYADDMYAAARGADALALVTEWREFRRPDFTRLKALMRTPAVFDGRNVWSPKELRGLGFHYYGIGRAARSLE